MNVLSRIQLGTVHMINTDVRFSESMIGLHDECKRDIDDAINFERIGCVSPLMCAV
jgi:hypothetical protein